MTTTELAARVNLARVARDLDEHPVQAVPRGRKMDERTARRLAVLARWSVAR